MYNTTQYVYISTYIQMFAAQIELRVVLHTYLSLLSGTIRYLLSAHDERNPTMLILTFMYLFLHKVLTYHSGPSRGLERAIYIFARPTFFVTARS